MPIIQASTLSTNSPSNILSQPYVSSISGNTYKYEMKYGGKHASKSKKRRSKKTRKTRRSRKTRYTR